MMQISETEAFRACRILFGRDLILNYGFLQYLQPSGAHSAFRMRAKATHPDSSHHQPHKLHNPVRQFQDLNQAHQLLQHYLRQRDLLTARKRTTTATRTPRPTGSGQRNTPHSQTTHGPLPTKPLQFGLFLFHRGLISFSALIGALTWQRRQRPTFGQIAQRWGWLGEQEIKKVLNHRKLGRFGERAENLGLLSTLQVRAILLHQRTQQEKIGSYFVEQNLLTAEELTKLLGELSDHNLKYRHGYPHHFFYHH